MRRWRQGVALGFLLALLVAACGDDAPGVFADASHQDTRGDRTRASSDARLDSLHGDADVVLQPEVKDVCVPDCEGKECGDDGCGGSCGECDDFVPCTVDSCNAELGQCFHEPLVPCPEDPICPVGPCELLTFDTGAGTYVVEDTCVPPDACHTARCSPETGDCLVEPIPCPEVDCQVGTCNPETGSCAYSPLCDDGDPCTEDYCSPTQMCMHSPLCCSNSDDCDLETPCASSSCSDDGECSHEVLPLPDCCQDDSDCGPGGAWDDEDPSTIDYCKGFQCVHVSEPCYCIYDGHCPSPEEPCLESKCIDQCWCSYVDLPGCCVDDSYCEDGEACTADDCDVAVEKCKSEWVCLHDGDPSTVDLCDPLTGELFHLPD
jgi:hypothetical protein